MILRLRFVRPGDRERAVLVDADPEAPLSEVLHALDLPEAAQLYRADGAPLAGTATLRTSGLLDGDLVSATPTVPARVAAPRLRIVAGPDTGREFELTRPANHIGRSPGNEIVLRDDEVSRRHAVIRLGSHVTIEDLGSTNGTTVDGTPLVGARVLRPGGRAEIGLTTVALVSDAVAPEALEPTASASLRPDGEGGLLLNRVPSLRRPHRGEPVQYPSPLRRRERRTLPWIPALVPLVFAGAIFLITGNTSFLLFALLSPLTLGATLYTNRRSDKRRAADEHGEFEAARAQADAAVRRGIDDERRWWREAAPGGGEAAAIAGQRSLRLWERSPDDADFTTVAVGFGSRPAGTSVSLPPGTPGHPDLAMPDVPLTVSLSDCGVLGLAGPDTTRAGIARSMLTQLAALHADDDVRIALLAEHPTESDWDFLRWLPHTWHANEHRSDITYTPADFDRTVDMLLGVIAERAGAHGVAGRESSDQVWVVVLDHASVLRQRADVARLLAVGPKHGVFAIALDSDARLVPEERRVLVTVDAAGAVRVENFVDRAVWMGTADSLSRDAARAAAVRLAPIRRVGGRATSGGLPIRLSLYELLGGPPTAVRVAEQWSRARRQRPVIPVGRSATGTFGLDLVRSGPHALVGGTSGSGKSEFIQTWVASTALHSPPDEVTFLFVEYKGLSAFRHLQHLPHCVGTITNLSPELTTRALTSMTAELRRRQLAFVAAEVGDIDEYAALRRSRPDLPVLPRLVIVLDEFAEMKQQMPEFIEGLISIARTGRSLGVHLILATQQVGRAVSGDIAGNANLRISLRATTPEDSYAVIEANDAAQLPQDVPGRALAKRGELPIEAFQAAWCGGPVGTAQQSGAGVEPWPWNAQDAKLQTIARASLVVRSELVDAVELAAQVATEQGIQPPSRPFSNPLSTVIPLHEVQAEAPVDALADFVNAGGPYVGRRDDPAAQVQEPYAIPLLRGHVAVVGSAQSGRTTLLRTTAAAWASAVPPTTMHLHAIDGARGLLALGGLPHTGTIATVGDARSIRLLTRLAAEVDRRLDLLSANSMGEVLEWWTLPAPDEPLPWIVLIVDRFEDLLNSVERSPAEAALERLLTHGTAAGVTVLAAGDETLIRMRWQGRFPVRLVLRNSGGLDSIQAGLPPRLALDTLAPGRGYETASANLVQIAVLGDDTATARQNEVLRRLATELTERWAGAPSSPLRLRELPPVVDASALPAAATTDGVVLGVGGDAAEPFELGADRLPLLVAGAEQTGRSTTLRRMAASWVAAGRATVVLAPTGTPLLSRPVPGATTHTFTTADVVPWNELLADPNTAIVVDDMHRDDLPDDFVAAMTSRVPSCLFAGSMRGLTLVPEPLLTLARRGTLLYLCPDEPRRLAAYGVRVDAAACFTDPVGRGILAGGRAITLVQVAVEGDGRDVSRPRPS